ncbi:Neutral/alkaline nonlysosomal ceramidase [Acaromyces ingoldii]|uniref:Neutral ceramidase n=1 Tax=Acaromyces ingoldii TaxID=215250 RepID=A0A316YDF0_9BASI|nr:Neutral/alkaline nonlysosomal ceramidase [Acaromyces ingoldii]PWN87536.1 Neutral/alkaline nonlysosomal ceramidase [Acaromyces ingoldii]
MVEKDYVSIPQEDILSGQEEYYDDGKKPTQRWRKGARSTKGALIAASLGALVLLALVYSGCSKDGSVNRCSAAASADGTAGLIFGLGTGDVSGPIVQTGMMGYASLPQVNTGLHIRQRSRAFIVGTDTSDEDQGAHLPDGGAPAADDDSGRPDPNDGLTDRWVYINSDICMGDSAVRRAIVNRLRQQYPGIYGERNVAFAGTHSHSGPGGFLNALIPTVTNFGVVDQTFNAIVEGTVRAVQKAHDDYMARRDRATKGQTKAKIYYGNSILKEAHINRSPFSYLQNPQEERDKYDSDQDDVFHMLQFLDDDGKKGLLSFYPVHGTSLYENNTLSSADNKGLAALMVEQQQDPSALPGQAAFVAGFSQANVGDTTPNVGGAFCDDGNPCDFEHSTCPNDRNKQRVENCHGRGPTWGDESLLAGPTGGWDFSGNEKIARYQADAALGLLDASLDSMTEVAGVVRSVKWNVAMNNFTFPLSNGTQVTTCPSALGYGFAGGTTDGPGAFDFVQGANSSEQHNPLWDIARTLVTPPSKKQIECQKPKRVLLSIGEQNLPYPWGPGGKEGLVETQILRAGNVFVLVVPGEFTTMAGRRIKDAVKAKILDLNILAAGLEPIVLIGGPASTYGHYITTREEYSVQRYEGGSTLFGPNTLEAYTHIFANFLTPALKDDEAAKMVPAGQLPELSFNKALRLGEQPIVYDRPAFGHKFGDVLVEPLESYQLSAKPNVTAQFVGANPRNDLRLEATYTEVQKQRSDQEPQTWDVVRTDGHHSTVMRWTQTNKATGSSVIDYGWTVEDGTSAGRYRLVYYGSAKTPVTGKIQPFVATSREFTLE